VVVELEFQMRELRERTGARVLRKVILEEWRRCRKKHSGPMRGA
jgi:hypothetical protein